MKESPHEGFCIHTCQFNTPNNSNPLKNTERVFLSERMDTNLTQMLLHPLPSHSLKPNSLSTASLFMTCSVQESQTLIKPNSPQRCEHSYKKVSGSRGYWRNWHLIKFSRLILPALWINQGIPSFCKSPALLGAWCAY